MHSFRLPSDELIAFISASLSGSSAVRWAVSLRSEPARSTSRTEPSCCAPASVLASPTAPMRTSCSWQIA
eukprot:scaffold111894_cov90-Phaeocystis_antarctica.AAC.3